LGYFKLDLVLSLEATGPCCISAKDCQTSWTLYSTRLQHETSMTLLLPSVLEETLRCRVILGSVSSSSSHPYHQL